MTINARKKNNNYYNHTLIAICTHIELKINYNVNYGRYINHAWGYAHNFMCIYKSYLIKLIQNLAWDI